jgi:hypothetical protein
VLHERDVALDLETFYWRAVHALDDDDYEEVRTQALHLVWYPSPFGVLPFICCSLQLLLTRRQ